MSQYLINVERAIAQTNVFACSIVNRGEDYFEGWQAVKPDLEYGMKLSEQAIREHLDHWLSQPDTVLAEDQGYYDRCKAIFDIVNQEAYSD